MAASSSDESSTAPRDFHLSSSLDSGSRLSPNKHRCPLCHKFRRTFYCKECVHSGVFYRSKCPATEGYADKQKIFLELEINKHTIKSTCEQLLETYRQADVLRSKIRHNQERNRILKLSVEEKRKKKIDYNRELKALMLHNEKRSKNLPRYEKKVQEMEQYVGDEQEKLSNNKIVIQERKEEIKRLVKVRLQQLFRYIFPIDKVHPKIEMESVESDMVMALAEASQTSYLDSWELADNSGEMKYSVCGPTLPGSGNYTCYNMWVAQNREGVMPGGNTSCTIDHHNPAYSISAALTYTTQLVYILSFYLNMGLPFKLFYSDFCNRELSEQQFTTRVARLNANILYLCYSQNIDLSCLRSCETVHNLLQLVNAENEDLGRDGPVDLDAEKVSALEKPIVNDLQKSEDSDSEEGSSFLVEWEALPNMQYPEIPAGPGNIQSTQIISAQQASSMAGGLVNSAAASIVSIWRGFTGR